MITFAAMEAIIPYLIEWGYWGLFLSAFLAGSILPFSSEAVLVALILPQVGLNPTLCVLLGGLGNLLGGMTCYYLGHLGKIAWIERWLGVKEEKLRRMIKRLHNKSALMAFFTFVPIIGDVIAVALGYLRTNPWWVALAMFIGKLIRYTVIAYATLVALN